MTKRSLTLVLMTALVLSLVLLFDLLPILRGGEVFNWQWTFQRVPLPRIALLCVVMAVYLAGASGLVRRHKWGLLLWACLGATLMPLAVTYLREDYPVQALFYRTISPTTTGQHLAGARIDWGGTAWQDWASAMRDFQTVSVHVALSPPALPMVYGGLDALLATLPDLAHTLQRPLLDAQCHNQTFLELTEPERASAWLGILMPLWASLAVFPLYALAKRTTDETRARWVACAWALVPALSMFAPTWNTLYPALALVAFWLLQKGLDALPTPASDSQRMGVLRGAGWLIASGFVVGGLTFANFSVVPLAGLCGFYVLLQARPALHPRHLLVQKLVIGAWFGVGVMLVWGSYMVLTHTSPLQLLNVAFDKHLSLNRPYLPWLWMHTWEWALFTGLPWVGLWMSDLRGAFRRQHVLPLALALTLLVLVLSNTARGETGRVWLFFAPFVLLSAVSAPAVTDDAHRPAWSQRLLVFLVAQALICIALASTWDVIVAPDIHDHPPTPPVVSDVVPQNATFGDAFVLTGWRGDSQADGIRLSLNWHTTQPIDKSYFFSALLVAPDGSTPYPATIWQPQTGYLTTCWAVGDSVGDSVLLPMPADAPRGQWYVSLSAFADVANPMNTLSVTGADGTLDRQIGLGGIGR